MNLNSGGRVRFVKAHFDLRRRRRAANVVHPRRAVENGQRCEDGRKGQQQGSVYTTLRRGCCHVVGGRPTRFGSSVVPFRDLGCFLEPSDRLLEAGAHQC